MNFDFTEKQKDLRNTLKGLFDKTLLDKLAGLKHADFPEIKKITSHCIRLLGQTGYLELCLDENTNRLDMLAAQEILAEISPPLFLIIETNAHIFGRLVASYGSNENKSEILEALKKGELIGAAALSEGNTNLEGNPLKTRASLKNGSYILEGSKTHALNAPIADWIAVGAVYEGRPAFFLVRAGSKGLDTGQSLSAMGYNGIPASAITLQECNVDASFLLGPFDDDQPLEKIRLWEDHILTAAGLGLANRSYRAALKYAKEHQSGGKPIIAYQEVGFKLAEMLTLLQTAQLLAYRAAWMDGAMHKEARVVSRCAKVFCTECTEKIASDALQILGAQGYFSENPAEEGFRNSKYLQIAGTSSEISRMKIADTVLGP